MIKKLRKSYRAWPLPVKASFWFILCNFAQKAVTMITTPVFTRIMPMEEYGNVSTFLSWQVLFDYILTLCLTSCAMQLYVRRQDKEYVLSSLCSLEFFVMGIWVILFLIFLKPISALLKMSKVLCICMVVTIWFNQSIQLWMGYKRYKYEYRASVIVTFLLTIISSFCGAFAVMFISPTAESRLIPVAITTTLIGGYLYIKIIFRNKVVFDKTIWITAFSFGIPFIFTNLSHFILASSDRIMINYICGSSDVAIYGIAYSVGTIISIFTSAINASFSPYSYQKIKQKEFDTLSKRTTQIVKLIAILMFFIMMFGREIILIFGGNRYSEASAIIIPICLGIYFNYIVTLFARIQEYLLKKGPLLLMALFCAILNIFLNFIFIRLYGYKAAAYTTFICYFIFCFVHYIVYRITMKKSFSNKQIYNIKNLVLVSAMLVLSGGLITIISHWLVVKYCIINILFALLLFNRRKIIELIKGI